MGNKTPKATYPVTLVGLGSNPNYTIDNDENFVYIKPSPPYPTRNLANNCTATGQYDNNTNTLYVIIQCPTSVVRQTLQNCTLANGNITCPIPVNIEAINQFRNIAEPMVSYLQNDNKNGYLLAIVVIFIILILFCNSKR